MLVALAAIGALELVLIVWAVALCRAAARRPKFGPPLTPNYHRRRSTD